MSVEAAYAAKYAAMHDPDARGRCSAMLLAGGVALTHVITLWDYMGINGWPGKEALHHLGGTTLAVRR